MQGQCRVLHLSCAVNYAKQKYKPTFKDEDEYPWETCPNCHQSYRGDFAIDMANKYVGFIEENYPHNHNLILRAKVGRLESLTAKNPGRTYSQTKEAEQVANSIIHKVEQMKLRRIQITGEDRVFEAYAYEILGCMIYEEADFDYRVKRRLPEAIRYLEKSLELSTANNFDYGIVRAKGMILKVKSKLSGQVDEESLKTYKIMYEQQIKTFGKSHSDPIKSGMDYAEALKLHNFGVKAERLFLELYEISTRYHGPDHELTKDVIPRSVKDYFRSRIVSVASNQAGEFQSFQAFSIQDFGKDNVAFYQLIHYSGSFKRCIVFGPLIWSSTTTNNALFLSSDDIIFALGTPVICHGLERVDIDGQLGDVRSWNNETKCYTVHWEDESLEPCEVHQSNVRVPNCICDNCMKGLESECVLNRK